MLKAIELGKPVLVEKPIALTLADADRVIQAVEKAGANVRVGYSRRYKERYLIAKEQIVQGRVGTIVGGAARVYNSRSQGMAVLTRDRHATPVVDALTYYVDLMGWLLGGTPLAEVYARGQKGVLKQAGFEANDVDWAVFTYADGTVVNLGISYALPDKYPARGHAARVEILGTEGVIILDDDHTDQLMYTGEGHPPRVPARSGSEHGLPAERHAGRLGAGRVLGPDRQRDAGLARPPLHGQAVRARHRARGARGARGDARHRAFAGQRQAGALAAGRMNSTPKSLTAEDAEDAKEEKSFLR